jgi:2-polyprenyl-3-methyl-5-hydroxy-6-metoxy-1,4-benzoquinol methylase
MLTSKYYDAPSLYELAFALPPQSVWKANSFSAVLQELEVLDRGARSLLDIGCGTGILPKMIALRHPRLRIKAIDCSRHMIQYASRVHSHTSIEYRVQDFWEENGRYDRVTSTYSWYFFPPESAARKLKSVLSPGGCALIVDTRETPITRTQRRIFGFLSGQFLSIYKPEEVSRTLEREGFSTTWRTVDRREGSYLVVARLA